MRQDFGSGIRELPAFIQGQKPRRHLPQIELPGFVPLSGFGKIERSGANFNFGELTVPQRIGISFYGTVDAATYEAVKDMKAGDRVQISGIAEQLSSVFGSNRTTGYNQLTSESMGFGLAAHEPLRTAAMTTAHLNQPFRMTQELRESMRKHLALTPDRSVSSLLGFTSDNVLFQLWDAERGPAMHFVSFRVNDIRQTK